MAAIAKRQTGIALVLVLWVISLLTIMGGSFALSMRREASIVAGEKDHAQAVGVAEAGIALAQLQLLGNDANKSWRTDGSVYQINFIGDVGEGVWKVRLRLLSESGKVDINVADETVLQKLLGNSPLSAEEQARLVGAIIDWRDADDLVHLQGAEQKEYQQAGLNYVPANKPFQTIEELQWVLGMDETVYQWLEPLITVNSGLPQVDFTKASPEVLAELGNLDTGTLYNYVFARLDSARNNLPPPAFPGQPVKTGSTVAGTGDAGTKAEAVTIQSEAVLVSNLPDDDEDEATQAAAVNALLEKSTDNTENPTPFTVLKWQRKPTKDASLFSEAMDDLIVKNYAEFKFNH